MERAPNESIEKQYPTSVSEQQPARRQHQQQQKKAILFLAGCKLPAQKNEMDADVVCAVRGGHCALFIVCASDTSRGAVTSSRSCPPLVLAAEGLFDSYWSELIYSGALAYVLPAPLSLRGEFGRYMRRLYYDCTYYSTYRRQSIIMYKKSSQAQQQQQQLSGALINAHRFFVSQRRLSVFMYRERASSNVIRDVQEEKSRKKVFIWKLSPLNKRQRIYTCARMYITYRMIILRVYTLGRRVELQQAQARVEALAKTSALVYATPYNVNLRLRIQKKSVPLFLVGPRRLRGRSRKKKISLARVSEPTRECMFAKHIAYTYKNKKEKEKEGKGKYCSAEQAKNTSYRVYVYVRCKPRRNRVIVLIIINTRRRLHILRRAAATIADDDSDGGELIRATRESPFLCLDVASYTV
ncbi:unnamed protein product [Trichogramma brassicae]|uniref:Uncharacterized protein n=1 Tax=Trichogramma brassicae TaxID=86971 RepID=A0A6H5J930_9HYME|nr:unnamed protein product [Trichogramma brassicae]